MDSTKYIELVERLEKANLEILMETADAVLSGDHKRLEFLEQEAIVLKKITKIVCMVLASRVEEEDEEA